MKPGWKGSIPPRKFLPVFSKKGSGWGPIKRFRLPADAARVNVFLISEMSPEFSRKLLLTPAASVEEAFASVSPNLPPNPRVAVMPNASSTIPYLP